MNHLKEQTNKHQQQLYPLRQNVGINNTKSKCCYEVRFKYMQTILTKVFIFFLKKRMSRDSRNNWMSVNDYEFSHLLEISYIGSCLYCWKRHSLNLEGKWDMHLIFNRNDSVMVVSNSHTYFVLFSISFLMKKTMNRNINAKEPFIITDFIIIQT